MSNVITATFEAGSRYANATPFLWQWDYGQQLQIEGLELPTACQVHFSNLEVCGFSVTAIATDGLVEIPNELLTSGQPVYAFVYLHTDEADGETECRVTCYVNRRPQPVNPDPTPGQQDSIDQAIAALNSAVDQAESSAAEAAESAAEAAGVKDQLIARIDATDAALTAETTARENAVAAEAAARTAADTALGDDVSDVKSATEDSYLLDSCVKYWGEYEKLDIDPAYTAKKVSVDRLGQITVFGGEASNITHVKVSGLCDRAATNNARNQFTKEISLKQGHKYALSGKVVSGSYSPNTSALILRMFDSNNNTIISINVDGSGHGWFSPVSDLTANIVLTLPVATISNLKVFVTLQDVTLAGDTNGVYSDIYTRLSGMIDPDTFEGSDRDKIISAMGAVEDTGHGVILIKRTYNITASIPITHFGSADARLIFLGIGNNACLNMNGVKFYGAGTAKSYGALAFVNIRFVGTSTLFDTDYLIRVNFDQCVFDGFGLVSYTNRFTQSYYYNNCLFRNITSYVAGTSPSSDDTASLVDVHFAMCLCEHGAGFISAYSLHGVYIANSCIEGMSGKIINVNGDARGLIVRDCYFESNNEENDGGGVHFDFSKMLGNIQNVVIDGNRFAGQNGTDNIILLPNKIVSNTHITITNNIGSGATAEGNCNLVKAHANATDLYKNVWIEGNTFVKYNDPNRRLVVRDRCGVYNALELEDNADCDDVAGFGWYHAASTLTVSHAPASGEFYLQNIIANGSFAQIAITSTGIKSRFGTGEWV